MRRVDEIAEAIRRDIRSGRTPVNSVLPTENELQAQFLASRSTIRRALDELIATGWAFRLPNRGVQAQFGPQGPVSSMVAFVDHADTIHKTLFFGLGQILADSGLHVVHVDSTRRGTVGALEHAAASGFAAAICWGKEMLPDRSRFEAVASRMPVIAVDHCPNGISVDVVRGDHFGGAREAVGHLLDLGRRQIALSGFLTMLDDARERMLGYAAAHTDHDRAIQAHNIVFSSCVTGPELDDPRLLSERLRQKDRPDAVFVLHDISVPAIACAVLDAGLSIPEDVAIVGFGNDLPFTLGSCGLTTVGIDWQGVARALKDRLLQRLKNPGLRTEEIVVPARLIIRGSCGAPQEHWSDQEYQVSSATLTRRMPNEVWRSEFTQGVKPPVPSSLSLSSVSTGSSTRSRRCANVSSARGR